MLGHGDSARSEKRHLFADRVLDQPEVHLAHESGHEPVLVRPEAAPLWACLEMNHVRPTTGKLRGSFRRVLIQEEPDRTDDSGVDTLDLLQLVDDTLHVAQFDDRNTFEACHIVLLRIELHDQTLPERSEGPLRLLVGSHRNGIQLSRRERHGPTRTFPQEAKGGNVHQDRERYLQERGRLCRHPACVIEGEALRPSSKLDHGADVFTTVDAVTGRPDDLGHVGPHLVEPGSAKGSPVPCTRHGDLTGIGLFPDAGHDFRGPVVVAQSTKAGVRGPGHDVVLAFLDAPKTTHAHVVARILDLERIESTLPIDVVDARSGLDATHAPQASLRLEGAELGDRGKPGRYGLHAYVVFLWHL